MELNELCEKDLAMFVKRLKDYMWDNHLTQQQIANMADVSQPTINSYLTGTRNPTLINTLKICRGLGFNLFRPEDDVQFAKSNNGSEEKSTLEKSKSLILGAIMEFPGIPTSAKVELYNAIIKALENE